MKCLIAEKIAKEVHHYGGRTFYVGGCVRDQLLEKEPADIDIEIHGITTQVLEHILAKFGKVLHYGKCFGIYAIEGEALDISLIESRCDSSGKIVVDTYRAAQRRDFTINAMMKDVLRKELIDGFGGYDDLKKGIIRSVSSIGFAQDPLRVLRAFRFASQFLFEVDLDTQEMCRNIDISKVSKERIEAELRKVLLYAKKPSVFFRYLKKTNHLHEWFYEIEQLDTVKADSIYHVGDSLFEHTMMMLDEAVKYRDRTDNPFHFMLLVLMHNIGKKVVFEDTQSQAILLIKKALLRFTGQTDTLRYVLNLSQLHMQPNRLIQNHAPDHLFYEMFYQAIDPKDLVFFALCNQATKDEVYLFEKLSDFQILMQEPYITGDDLIKMGIKPGKIYAQILAYLLQLRFARVEKEQAIQKILSYAKGVEENESEPFL